MKKKLEFNEFDEFDDHTLNNKGFERTELIVIVGVLSVIIGIGIIVGIVISNANKDKQGIVMVNYNANGGTGTMEGTQCKKGSDCVLKNSTFEKEGYQFAGWSTSENENVATYTKNSTYKANKDITLYAVWEKKDIIITFDANSGTGNMESITYTYGEQNVELPENKFKKTGYTFNHWNIYCPTLDKWYGCTDSKSECNDKDNATLGWHDRNKIKTYYNHNTEWNGQNTDYDIVFYAQWGEEVYKITYELNGGTIGKDAPVSAVYGSTVTINNPTRTGFTFTGWTISIDESKINNNEQLQDKGETSKEIEATMKGTELTIGTSDIILTANWTATIADYIQNLYKNTTTRKANSLAKDATNDTNIRYVGSSPNNFVIFNNELWRIIGVFNVNNGNKTSRRVKLIRHDNLINASWDSSAKKVNLGMGINEWSQADIQIILNEYYAGNSTSCKYCNDERQEKCENDCASIVKKLGADAKKMIENAVWYTGGIQFGDKDGEEITSAPDAYSRERGTRGGRNCKASGTKGYCTDKVERTTSWTGLVGLLYPSDYGYASGNNSCLADITYNNVCSSNNWLSTGYSYWTMTPRDSNYFANAGWHVGIGALGDNVMSTSKSIKPVVYLKDSIKVLNGDGTEDNPYKLGF